MKHLSVAALCAVALFGGVSAAQTLPDRRAVRPGAPAPAPAPAPAVPQQSIVELLGEIQTLQQQLRELRGQLEVQGHQLEQLKQRQQQVMVDLDKRLRDLERRSAAAAPETGASPPVTVITPPVGGASPPSAGPAPRAVPTQSEQQQYDAAFGLMKQGLYEQAAKSFRDFVARNPKGGLADNAQYWVGEAAYVMRDFRTALDEFGKVISNYPQSPKVPDALLKIGYTHYELGVHDKAREALLQVMSRYPNTVVARSAQIRLDKMGKEAR